MTEYIKREDVIKAIESLQSFLVYSEFVGKRGTMYSAYDIGKAIEMIPSADVVEIKKEGEWDMFDLISSAYYGKGMYFKQDNGTVYSRHSGEYMTVDEAIREFISLIDMEELPTYALQKRGKWEERIVEDPKYDPYGFFKRRWYCSACGKWQTYGATEYCPNCGADMRGKDNG